MAASACHRAKRQRTRQGQARSLQPDEAKCEACSLTRPGARLAAGQGQARGLPTTPERAKREACQPDVAKREACQPDAAKQPTGRAAWGLQRTVYVAAKAP